MFSCVPLCTVNSDGLHLESTWHGKAMLFPDMLGARHTITKPRSASGGEVSGAELHAKQWTLKGLPYSSLQVRSDLLQLANDEWQSKPQPRVEAHPSECSEVRWT